MDKNSPRIVWVDELRGFACLLVILLHVSATGATKYGTFSTQSWQFYNFVDSFARIAVPLFFALSGYIFFYRKAPRGRHFCRLILNILFYSIISFLFLYFLCNKSINEIDFNILNGPAYWHLWFFYYILQIYLVAVIINFKDINLKYFLLILFVIFIIFNPKINDILGLFGFEFKFYGFFDTATIFFVLYAFIGAVIGHCEKLDEFYHKKIITYCFIIFFVSWIIMALGTYYLSRSAGMLIEKLYDNQGVLNFLMTITTIVIFKETRKSSLISKFLCSVSKYSLPIYGIHVFIINAPFALSLRNLNHPLIDIVTTFIVVFVCSYTFARCIGYLDKHRILV